MKTVADLLREAIATNVRGESVDDYRALGAKDQCVRMALSRYVTESTRAKAEIDQLTAERDELVAALERCLPFVSEPAERREVLAVFDRVPRPPRVPTLNPAVCPECLGGRTDPQTHKHSCLSCGGRGEVAA